MPGRRPAALEGQALGEGLAVGEGAIEAGAIRAGVAVGGGGGRRRSRRGPCLLRRAAFAVGSFTSTWSCLGPSALSSSFRVQLFAAAAASPVSSALPSDPGGRSRPAVWAGGERGAGVSVRSGDP